MSAGRPTTVFDALDRTPLSYAILIAYVLLAIWTDPMNPSTLMLVEHGAAAGMLVQDGEPWRLLTAAFLHGGLLHLGLNSYALYWIGPQLEARLGTLRFGLLYVVSAVFGNVVAVTGMAPAQLLVGGSGALFGMFGAAIALMSRQGRTQLDFLESHGGRQLLGLVVANLAIGLFVPMISNSAHVGGLVSGFVLTFLFLERGRIGADGISRAAQAGWLALFAGLTLYACFPVLRWDYQMRRIAEARATGDTGTARAWLGAVRGRLTIYSDLGSNEVWGERGREILDRWMHDD